MRRNQTVLAWLALVCGVSLSGCHHFSQKTCAKAAREEQPTPVIAPPLPPAVHVHGKKRQLFLDEAVALALAQGRYKGIHVKTLAFTPTITYGEFESVRQAAHSWRKCLFQDDTQKLQQAARDAHQHACLKFEQQMQEIALEVKIAYWNLHTSFAIWLSREVARNQIRQDWEIAHTLFQEGHLTRQDLERATEQWRLFDVEVLQAIGLGQNHPGVLEAEQALRRVLGMCPEDGTRLVPADAPLLPATPPDWETAARTALHQNPELALARHKVCAARHALQNAASNESGKAKLILAQKQAALKDATDALLFSLTRTYRQVCHAHQLCRLLKQRRQAAARGLDVIVAHRREIPQSNIKALLTARRNLAYAHAEEQQALSAYHIAVAQLTRLQGIMLQLVPWTANKNCRIPRESP